MKAAQVEKLRHHSDEDIDWLYRYISALESVVTPEQIDVAVAQANRGWASVKDLPGTPVVQ